jgi:hypothetical protein
MGNFISCCGLDCETCDAWIATMNNDNELRKATAEKWQTLYNVPNISFVMINCTGCREAGAKIGHHAQCEIRLCAVAKGFETCGQCADLETCSIISGLHQAVPDAMLNLRKLY